MNGQRPAALMMIIIEVKEMEELFKDERKPLISANRISEIFYDCLYKDEEIVDGKPVVPPTIGVGIRMSEIGFFPERLEGYRKEIEGTIGNLPSMFRDGWSFLNLCIDKEERQWGEHMNCEQLMALGTAIGKMVVLAPRELWPALPGGMPYLQTME